MRLKKRGMCAKSRLVRSILDSRKGADVWISTVLIMAFAVVMSVFMYNFMVDYTKSSTEDVKRIVYNADECRAVSLDINDVCISAQALNITLQNRNYIRIDKMDFRFYSGRMPVHTNLTNITMNPNRVKQLSLNTGASGLTRVEVIPHIVKEGMDIICSERKAEKLIQNCT